MEVFYEDALAPSLVEVFRELVAKAGLKTVLCQTFDAPLMALATAVPGQAKPVGMLFRTAADAIHRPRSNS